MTLTPEQKGWLKQIEPTYQHKGNDLQDLTGSFFVAPTQTGKSTLIEKVVQLGQSENNDIAEVDTITTRARRQNRQTGNDPAGYRTADEGIDHEWMVDQIEHQTLVNWMLFETGDMYGTDRQSFTAKHNLLPATEKSLRMLGSAGLGSVNVIYVVTPVNAWEERINEMMANNPENTLDRLKEAVDSLTFADDASGIIRVVNVDDEQTTQQTVESLLKIVTMDPTKYQSDILADFHAREFHTHSRAMYAFADKTLRSAGVR